MRDGRRFRCGRAAEDSCSTLERCAMADDFAAAEQLRTVLYIRTMRNGRRFRCGRAAEDSCSTLERCAMADDFAAAEQLRTAALH